MQLFKFCNTFVAITCGVERGTLARILAVAKRFPAPPELQGDRLAIDSPVPRAPAELPPSARYSATAAS